MKAHHHLVRYCLDRSHLISVWDGEEWQLIKSFNYREIVAAIESVEEAVINVWTHKDKSGKRHRVAWAAIVPYGVSDDETVYNNEANEFMEDWWDTYDQQHGETTS